MLNYLNMESLGIKLMPRFSYEDGQAISRGLKYHYKIKRILHKLTDLDRIVDD